MAVVAFALDTPPGLDDCLRTTPAPGMGENCDLDGLDVINTPATDIALSDNTFGTIAGRWNPGATPSPWTQYMLPGASSAPNALIMAPYIP